MKLESNPNEDKVIGIAELALNTIYRKIDSIYINLKALKGPTLEGGYIDDNGKEGY
jgi:hypothetical protein